MDLRSGALSLALAAGITIAAWGWWQRTQLLIAQQGAEGLAQQLETVQGEARRNLDTATQLQSTLKQEREAQARLLRLQGALRGGLAERERLIEDLKHENKELREWADQPLPDTARRLRKRPAIVGADAYRQWLSSGSTVPTAGNGADPQRADAQ